MAYITSGHVLRPELQASERYVHFLNFPPGPASERGNGDVAQSAEGHHRKGFMTSCTAQCLSHGLVQRLPPPLMWWAPKATLVRETLFLSWFFEVSFLSFFYRTNPQVIEEVPIINLSPSTSVLQPQSLEFNLSSAPPTSPSHRPPRRASPES